MYTPLYILMACGIMDDLPLHASTNKEGMRDLGKCPSWVEQELTATLSALGRDRSSSPYHLQIWTFEGGHLSSTEDL